MRPLPSLAGKDWLEAPALRKVFAIIEEAGGEVRVNGGAVRNTLLGEPVADIDLSTTLQPRRIAEICEAAGLAVHPTGIDHGTLTVVSGDRPFEITTLRVDVETFGRRARIAFTDDWEADAHRRDFTVNALYCKPDGEIVDFVEGYRDILRRRIRFVGEPARRIEEDFLQILRFFRFHARHGKGPPDREGLAACTRWRRGLDTLPAERIRQEFLKLIVAPRAAAVLEVMRDRKVLAHVIAAKTDLKVFKSLARIDLARALAPDAVLRLAALVADPLVLQERLRLTNAEVKRLTALAGTPPPGPDLREAERRRILYRVGAQAWCDSVRLAWARSGARPGDPAWRELLGLTGDWRLPQFPVSGADLRAVGLAPGPEFGRMLAELEDFWVASDFTPSRVELLGRLTRLPR